MDFRGYGIYTRCALKVSIIFNFRGLCIFIFKLFVALCWYSFMPTSTAILNVQLIFDSFFYDFCLFQKMDQRICIKLSARMHSEC